MSYTTILRKSFHNADTLDVIPAILSWDITKGNKSSRVAKLKMLNEQLDTKIFTKGYTRMTASQLFNRQYEIYKVARSLEGEFNDTVVFTRNFKPNSELNENSAGWVAKNNRQYVYEIVKDLIIENKICNKINIRVEWFDVEYNISAEFAHDSMKSLVISEFTYDVSSIQNWRKKWRKIGFWDFNNSSNSLLWGKDCRKMTISRINPVKGKKMDQKFKDSKVGHCFISPFIKIFEDNIKSAKTKKTRQNYQSIVNYLNEKMKEYVNGIPENRLQEICNKTGYAVKIYNILKQKIYLNVEPQTKKRGEIGFLNSRANHVDELVATNKLEKKQPIELSNLIQRSLYTNEYCVFTGTKTNPTMVFTKTGAYQAINPRNELIQEFLINSGIDSVKFDKYEDLDFSEYVRSGCQFTTFKIFNTYDNQVNQLIEDSPGDGFDKKHQINKAINKKYPNICEYDMKKAYTQHSESQYYRICQFPSKLNHKRFVNIEISENKKFLETYSGIFTITQINFDNVSENTKKILNEYYAEISCDYTLPNPDLLFLIDNGATFKIKYGVWASKKMKFEYTKEIKSDKTIYPCIAGRLCQEKKSVYKYLTKDMDFINHVQSQFVGKCYYNRDLNELSIENDVTSNFWAPHISSFITSYTRINVLSKIIKMNYSDVVAVKLDSIVSVANYDKLFESDSIWEKKKEVNASCPWSSALLESDYITVNTKIFGNFEIVINEGEKPITILDDQFLSGFGGAGKTTSICDNKGFIDVLFVSFCWRLITAKMNEHNIKGTTIQSLIGIGTEPYNVLNRDPGLIFIDEATMINKEHLLKVQELYPHSQILIAGDIDEFGHYQCSISDNGGEVNVIKKSDLKDMKFIDYHTDYRAKDCERLQKVKLELREIVRDYHKGLTTLNDTYTKLYEYVNTNLSDRYISVSNMLNSYKYEESLLTPTKAIAKSYTDELLKRGIEPKYRMTHHNHVDLLRRIQSDKIARKQIKKTNNSLEQTKIDMEKVNRATAFDKYTEFEKTHTTTNVIHSNKQYLLNGEISKTKPQNGTHIVTHGFTIHSFQGLTANSNIYLNISVLLDVNLIYTAISRAKTIDNVFIIKQ